MWWKLSLSSLIHECIHVQGSFGRVLWTIPASRCLACSQTCCSSSACWPCSSRSVLVATFSSPTAVLITTLRIASPSLSSSKSASCQWLPTWQGCRWHRCQGRGATAACSRRRRDTRKWYRRWKCQPQRNRWWHRAPQWVLATQSTLPAPQWWQTIQIVSRCAYTERGSRASQPLSSNSSFSW